MWYLEGCQPFIYTVSFTLIHWFYVIKDEAKVANLFASGEIQEKFKAEFNVTLEGMDVQSPGSASEPRTLAKVDKIVVLQQADQCCEYSWKLIFESEWVRF